MLDVTAPLIGYWSPHTKGAKTTFTSFLGVSLSSLSNKNNSRLKEAFLFHVSHSEENKEYLFRAGFLTANENSF